jgi:hypothetical protein
MKCCYFSISSWADAAGAWCEDDFMLQLRVNNLVAPLADISEARLAKALVTVKPELAALIACHYFEILIRRLAGQFHLPDINSRSPLDDVIDSFPNYGPVDPLRRSLWKTFKSVRNELIHSGQMPGPRESQLLIEEVTKLESDMIAAVK